MKNVTKITMAIFLGLGITAALSAAYAQEGAKVEQVMQQAVETPSVLIEVNGLVCDFCAQAIKKVFSKKEEVANVVVDLSAKQISVWFVDGKSLDAEALTKLVKDAGYNVVRIHNATEEV